MAITDNSKTGRKRSALLWTGQGLLAAMFLFTGATKLVLPLDVLTAQYPFLPGAFVRFLGVAEFLGAFGLVLPGLFRVQRRLTPLAAAGLVLIMIGATAITAAVGGGLLSVMPAIVGLIAAAIARGRWLELTTPRAVSYRHASLEARRIPGFGQLVSQPAHAAEPQS